jgi:hypothetical protein
MMAVLVVVITGCSRGVPTEPVGIVGTVTDLQPGTGDVLYSIRVEGPDQIPGSVSDKAQVTVNKQTRLFAEDGTTAQPTDITQGDTVRVWFTGAVAESYPVQGTAMALQLVK